jgi:hypothetical protein
VTTSSARPDDLGHYGRVENDASSDLASQARQLDAALRDFLASATDAEFTRGVASSSGVGGHLMDNARAGGDLADWVRRIAEGFRAAEAGGLGVMVAGSAPGVVTAETDTVAWLALTDRERQALLARAEVLAGQYLDGFTTVAELREHAAAVAELGEFPLAAAAFFNRLGPEMAATIPSVIEATLLTRTSTDDAAAISRRLWQLLEPYSVGLGAATRADTFDPSFTAGFMGQMVATVPGKPEQILHVDGTPLVLLRFGEFSPEFLHAATGVARRTAEFDPAKTTDMIDQGWGAWLDPMVSVPNALANHPAVAADILGKKDNSTAQVFYDSRVWAGIGGTMPADSGEALARAYVVASEELYAQGRDRDAAFLTLNVLHYPLGRAEAAGNPVMVRAVTEVISRHQLDAIHQMANDFSPQSPDEIKTADEEAAQAADPDPADPEGPKVRGRAGDDGVIYDSYELLRLVRLINSDEAAADTFGAELAGWQASYVADSVATMAKPAGPGDLPDQVWPETLGAFANVQSRAYADSLEHDAAVAEAVRSRALATGNLANTLAPLPGPAKLVTAEAYSRLVDSVEPAPMSAVTREKMVESFHSELVATGEATVATGYYNAGALSEHAQARMALAAEDRGGAETSAAHRDGDLSYLDSTPEDPGGVESKPGPPAQFWHPDGTLMAWPDMDREQRSAFGAWVRSEEALVEPLRMVAHGGTGG